MSFGITAAGFSRMTLQDIRSEIIAEYEATIGKVNSAPDSAFSQVIDPQANQLARAWEVLEAVYQSTSPNGAVGVSLDNLASINFITRLAARATTVQAAITGTLGTTVPAATRAKVTGTDNLFAADADAEIDMDNALRATITVSTVANSTLYRVTIDSVNYDFTSDSDATNLEIAVGLASALAAASAVVTVVNNGDGSLLLTAADLETAFSVAVTANLTASAVYSPQAYTAIETGPVLCLTGTLTEIETPVSGLTAITNLEDGTLGRNAETDKDLRIRRLDTLARAGKATLSAIEAKLLSGDVEGITQILAYENVGDVADGDGRPPHSIEVVALGGDDTEIAKAIHATRPAGIQTHGNINGGAGITFLDAQGHSQTVEFSRPVERYAWVAYEYELYSEEEFPSDGEDQIAAAALAFGLANFGIGKNFLLQRFYAPAVSIPGVGRVTLTIAVTSAPAGSPSYGSTDIAVGPAEVLVFDSARITVSEA